jgi:hypothetical protein
VALITREISIWLLEPPLEEIAEVSVTVRRPLVTMMVTIVDEWIVTALSPSVRMGPSIYLVTR